MTEIQAHLNFLKHNQQKPTCIMKDYGMPTIYKGEYEECLVNIENGRDLHEDIGLDSHGFAFLDRPSDFKNFDSEPSIIAYYYAEITDLIREQLNARWVGVIDHTIRTSDSEAKRRGTAAHVHNDYTEDSARERLRRHVGDMLANDFLKYRFVQVNVWRPLVEPVRVAPLTVADGASIQLDDLVPCDLVYSDRVGEFYELTYNAKQRWIYFPDMLCNEVLLIKGYDSDTHGPVRFAPHAAFTHPDTQPGDSPRWSIEVRTFAVI